MISKSPVTGNGLFFSLFFSFSTPKEEMLKLYRKERHGAESDHSLYYADLIRHERNMAAVFRDVAHQSIVPDSRRWHV